MITNCFFCDYIEKYKNAETLKIPAFLLYRQRTKSVDNKNINFTTYRLCMKKYYYLCT